ncbi:hypothetical protein B0T20DRAFT_480436 [Sordaria brevicollis]|uniref:Uncharacterized protein n=1 Tax=Sordaria brevicollis TaxID=83679 RepID=A0AAE0PC22_SORBR|nr:hypothetical protein B0T20DRAFT_480436 [Sordaria brevicollis]
MAKKPAVLLQQKIAAPSMCLCNRQGSRCRWDLFSANSIEGVSADNVEIIFIGLFRLIFVLAAAWYVWDQGVCKDRNRSKLFVDCVLIVTVIVRTELSMELSLAGKTTL